MKNLVLILSLLSISSFASNGSLFEQYVPDSTCKRSCAKGIPKKVLRKFFEKAVDIAPAKLENTTYAFIVDFTQHSKNKRGYLLNLKNGRVSSYHVAHGRGSDRNHNGYADRFSDTNGSHMSSLGMYITAETYHGKHGYSLRLDGQEGSNLNARPRAIVKHSASYMSEAFIKKHGKAGRSHGCPAVSKKVNKKLINKLKGGSLYYIYH